MPATGKPTCGKWMPRSKTYCARTPGHGGYCNSEVFMERQRQLQQAKDRPYDPVAAHRWRTTQRLTRYGLTPEKFAKLLHDQDYACGMCGEPFKDGQRIHVDHDHNKGCHPGQKSACDRCRRGLLCLTCNVSLGLIESRLFQARKYLQKWK